MRPGPGGGRSSHGSVPVAILGYLGFVGLLGAMNGASAPATPLPASATAFPPPLSKEIDLVLERTPRDEALYRLADKAGIDLVCAGDVTGRVDGRFLHRAPQDVLTALLAEGRLVHTRVGTILVVAAHALPSSAGPGPAVAGPAITLRVTRAHVLPLIDALETDVDIDHVIGADTDPIVTAHLTRRPPAEALAALALAAGLRLDAGSDGRATLRDCGPDSTRN